MQYYQDVKLLQSLGTVEVSILLGVFQIGIGNIFVIIVSYFLSEYYYFMNNIEPWCSGKVAPYVDELSAWSKSKQFHQCDIHFPFLHDFGDIF